MNSERSLTARDVIDFDATGKVLKSMRVSLEIPVKELADEIGVTRPAIYRWENGHAIPTVYQLFLLSVYYKCRMEDLLVTYI